MKKLIFIPLIIIFVAGLILGGCAEEAPTPAPQPAKPTPAPSPGEKQVITPKQAPSPAPAPAPKPEKTIRIRIAGGMPPGHPISASVINWKDKLEKATNGRVEVTFYEGGTMGASTELYDMALSGIVEASHTAEFWAGGRFPIIEGLNNLPFNIQGINDILAVDSALYEAGLLQEMEPFKLLYFTPAAALSFFTKEKINTMEDLAGMKLRASGTAAKAVELMGATPVNAPGTEEYMMLERGTLDGNITGADNVYSRKLYEVIDYGNKNVFAGGGFIFIMNKEFWNSLPADIQATIDKLNAEGAQEHIVDQQAAIDQSWADLEKLITVYTIDEKEMDRWRQAVAPITDEWIQSMEARDLPGQKAYDLMQKVLKGRHGQ